jgi:hypothetical protein
LSFKFPEEDVPNPKYSFGSENHKISDIESLTLTFAYDYLSVTSTNLCFNFKDISAEDYRKLFEFKKEISLIPISELLDNSRYKLKYRFHTIDLSKKGFLVPLIKNLLGINNNTTTLRLPQIYQLALYTDDLKAPRIVGFFGNYAVFHLLWLDYNHSIYPLPK